MKAEMKRVKGKAGQGNTFWDAYQRIAVEQGVPGELGQVGYWANTQGVSMDNI